MNLWLKEPPTLIKAEGATNINRLREPPTFHEAEEKLENKINEVYANPSSASSVLGIKWGGRKFHKGAENKFHGSSN